MTDGCSRLIRLFTRCAFFFAMMLLGHSMWVGCAHKSEVGVKASTKRNKWIPKGATGPPGGNGSIPISSRVTLVEEVLQLVKRLTSIEKERRKDLFSKLPPTIEPTPIPTTGITNARCAATFQHPQRRGQNQNWLTHPCRLGAHMRAEVLRNPCILGEKSHFKLRSSWKELLDPAVQLPTDAAIAQLLRFFYGRWEPTQMGLELRRLKLHGQNHTKCTQFGPCKKIVFYNPCFLKTEY